MRSLTNDHQALLVFSPSLFSPTESFKYLKRNVELNSSKKVNLKERIECFNMDGRNFLQSFVLPNIAKRVREDEVSAIYKKEFFVVMNLPAIAIEFLDSFLPGCFDQLLGDGSSGDGGGEGDLVAADSSLNKPVVNQSVSNVDFTITILCYCFSNADDITEDVLRRVESALGNPAFDRDHHCELRNVRKVAPQKEMICAKIKLTPAILVADGEPVTKRQKTD